MTLPLPSRVAVATAVTLSLALLGCEKPHGDFDGTYRSSWGVALFRQKGDTVKVAYPRSEMTCQPSGVTLRCSWRSGEGSGKATLTRHPDRSLHGTWGRGESETDGGPWVFVPDDATTRR